MNLYRDAEKFLSGNQKDGSLRTRIFNASSAKQIKTDPKHVYALVSSTLKYKPFLLEIIKKSKLLKEEKKVLGRENLALLLVHDLLFSKSGRIQMGKTPVKEAVLKHKTRLNAELTKLKLKHRVRDLDELIEEDDTPVRWFRVNTIRSTKAQVLGHLVHLEQVPSLDQLAPGKIYHDEYVPDLFGVEPKEKITKLDIYKNGDIIIQDRASCFPAYILHPSEGDYVIDACAAPGNKTTHLASFVRNRPNSVIAFEKNPKRGEVLKTMVKKAGADKCVNVHVADFTSTNPADFPEITGMVVDPSCSGSGIFGRAVDAQIASKQPDAAGEQQEEVKDDYNEERLQKLASFQFSIVKHAMSFPNVKRIVYSTCSIHAQENEHVVIDLLNDTEVQKQGWKIGAKDSIIPTWKRRGLVDEFSKFDNAQELSDGCIRSLPKVDGGIGFFAVLFTRD